MLQTPARARAFPRVVALVALVGWFGLQRHALVQGDDFTSAAIGGATGGRFTLAAWAHQAVHDWWSATGRQSGTVFRVFQRMGTPVLHVVMALVEVLLAAALYAWARRDRLRDDAVACGLLAVLAACSVPAIALGAPRIDGDTLFWMLASFDYVFSPMVALAAGLQLVRIAEGRSGRLRRWLPVLLLAPVLHETSSLGLAAVVLGVLVLRGRGLGREERLAVGAVALGCLLQVTSPGMWKRAGAFTGVMREQGWRLRLHQAADAVAMLLLQGHWELLVASALLAVCGTVRRRRATTGGGLVVGLAVLLGWWQAQSFSDHGRLGYARALDGAGREQALLVVLDGAVVLLGLLATAWALRGPAGPRPLLGVLGLGGSFAPVLATGVTTPRAYLPALVWLAATIGCLAGDALAAPRDGARRPGRVAVAALVLVATACGLVWYGRSLTALRANDREHRTFERQVAAARAGRTDEVVLPAVWPAPDYLYSNAFLLSRYSGYMHLYYELPGSVRMVERP